MNETDQAQANRREFLRGGVRGALLTALAAVSAVLAKRNGGRLSGQTCVNQGICAGCAVFADCGLPAALSRKQVLSRGNRTRETPPLARAPRRAPPPPGERNSRASAAATEPEAT
jgi:hypothetical protein